MKSYAYDEVFSASLEYFGGDDLAAKVFVDKYALQNKEGIYLELTPKDMHHRMAKEFARIEAKYPNPMSEEEIFNLFDGFKYIIPQGSPMSAIGNPYQTQSLSNCFVIQGVYSDKLDSYGGIMLADQELTQIMKRRGGVGLDISGIRPKNMKTNNSAKTTDGIGIFMERFSNSCLEVAQNGRRGAEMMTISVNHPEIETFINIKRNLKKVTGANISIRFNDEFLNAVKANQEYILRWPVDVEPSKAKATKTVKAKEIWDQIIEAAWASAEPGLLFWDTVQKNTPSDIYADFGHKSISTNPCFSGETLIGVADGRNAVSIKRLAEEGKDVPVYSMDKDGQVSIKLGRNPRITGHKEKLVRTKLDDGSYLDTTPNHNFLLMDGTKVEAKKLKKGDSLPRFSKYLEPVKMDGKDYYRIGCDTKDTSKDKIFEHRIIAKYFYPEKWETVYNGAKESGFAKTGGLVVHHKDYNQLNNSPDNLEIMTFVEHAKFHGEKDNAGEKNGRFSGFTAEDIKTHALTLSKNIGRRFSDGEWVEYAAKNGLPQTFSDFRKDQLGTVNQLAKICASELGFEYIDSDPRCVDTYNKMLGLGYSSKIEDNVVYVLKHCEVCKNDFYINHERREGSICSIKCRDLYTNTDEGIKIKRNNGRDRYNYEKMKKNKAEQARVFSLLKFNLGRTPMMKEWEDECRKQNIPYRIGKSLRFGYKNYKEVEMAGNEYNHKVVSVEEIEGEHIVYNITVDDNHTVAIITSQNEKRKNVWYSGIYVAQCGEIILPAYDACRLMVLNLSSYVKNPFTKKSSFDYEMFSKHTTIAQRLMDDVIDLEIEAIDKIIEKIISDPETDEVKATELNLWKKIRAMNISGRRTGLGITALGDTVAMLGVRYGDKESINITSKIYRALAVAAHTSSCIMAKERGAFPIFNYDLEKNHNYLLGIFNDCDEETIKMWKKTGRRNIALTTTAPTGSVSTLTQTTSGIEPAFMLSYVRRKKINPSDKNAKIDFTDEMGGNWQQFTVYHHGVKQWMNITGETDITKSPYHGATSSEIDWAASVVLQAAAQKSIDHSISKTCNLPSNATKELVSEVYMKAWEEGCKGFTVYRDGCRSGVLISEDSVKKDKKSSSGRPEEIEPSVSPKRPNELICDVKKVKIQGESWTFFIGLLNDKPYEVFGGLSKYVDISNKNKRGRIIKNGKVDGITSYNLIIGSEDDEMTIKNIANVFENANYGAFTRTISLAMRHGVPIQFIVEQIQKDKNSDITSFSKVMARVLKSYVKDGTKADAGKPCPSCSQTDTLVYQEGCLTCKGCSYSKCN